MAGRRAAQIFLGFRAFMNKVENSALFNQAKVLSLPWAKGDLGGYQLVNLKSPLAPLYEKGVKSWALTTPVFSGRHTIVRPGRDTENFPISFMAKGCISKRGY